MNDFFLTFLPIKTPGHVKIRQAFRIRKMNKIKYYTTELAKSIKIEISKFGLETENFV
jgi:hypothetical protein